MLTEEQDAAVMREGATEGRIFCCGKGDVFFPVFAALTFLTPTSKKAKSDFVRTTRAPTPRHPNCNRYISNKWFYTCHVNNEDGNEAMERERERERERGQFSNASPSSSSPSATAAAPLAVAETSASAPPQQKQLADTHRHWRDHGGAHPRLERPKGSALSGADAVDSYRRRGRGRGG